MKDHDWDGSIVANNLRGCGQWVSNALKDWNDVSVDRCAFNPSTFTTTQTPVPEPGTIPLLMMSLLALGLSKRCIKRRV